jgi:hypothetical protein
MAGYKSPDFNERAAAGRAAQQRAGERLRNKPAPDPAAISERQAGQAASQAERSAACDTVRRAKPFPCVRSKDSKEQRGR